MAGKAVSRVGRGMHRAAVFGALALAIGMAATLRIDAAPIAGFCPPCFGFDRVAPGLWVVGGPSAVRLELPLLVDEARSRVAVLHGPEAALPARILACADAACADRLGAGAARGMTYGSALVVLRPNGLTVEVVAHELAHAALYHRIGWRAALAGAVPAWLNEGQAVLVARDPRHIAACPPALPPLPASSRAWRRAAGGAGASLYGLAACATERWMAERGGKAGFVDALDRVAAGAPAPF